MNIKEYIAGCGGGIFGTFMSHPFDTIRINKQLFPEKTVKTIVNSIKNKGYINFYKGLSAPFFGIGLEKALVFGTFYNMEKINKDHNLAKVQNGFIAGIVSTIVVTPVEKIKIDMQNNIKFKMSNYNPINLYRGWTPNMLREGSGYAIYFSIYENLKNKNDSKLTTFFKGAISGVGAWLFIYPFDYIKTLTQTKLDIGCEKTYSNIIRHQFMKYGIRGFYNGIELALMRCIPLHGGVFIGYEMIKSLNI